MPDRVRQISVLIFVVLDILSSFWLGDSLDQQAGDAPVYFLPFGLTFAIWGVIFTSQLVYAFYQAQPGQAARALHRRIGGWVALNAALTVLWNVTAGIAAQSEPEVGALPVWGTVIILIGMLFSLGRVFVILRAMYADLSQRDRAFAAFPFTVFFAWLNVALIANMTAALNGSGFTGGVDGAVWAAAMLVVAVLLASAIIRLTRLPVITLSYAGVIIWAVLGILFNNTERSLLIVLTCLVVMGVIALGAVVRLREQSARSQSIFARPA